MNYTAKSQGLAICHCCDKVCRLPTASSGRLLCPRCGTPVHQRTPYSLARTWAMTITACIFLIPANTLPVMTVIYLGVGEPDTIYSGVVELAHNGLVFIAAIVFIASILVPVVKLLGIIFLLLVVQMEWRLSAVQCTWLYRVIELIGRWSMLDLFVISILLALVDMGQVANIKAGMGATAFASVVVITMLAAYSFDPRLLWDLEDKQRAE